MGDQENQMSTRPRSGKPSSQGSNRNPHSNRGSSRPRSFVYHRTDSSKKEDSAGAVTPSSRSESVRREDNVNDTQPKEPAPKRARAFEVNKNCEDGNIVEHDDGELGVSINRDQDSDTMEVRNDDPDNGQSGLNRAGSASSLQKFQWSFHHTRDCPVVEDRQAMAVILRHFKPRGCAIPALRNMAERSNYTDVLEAVGNTLAAFHRCIGGYEVHRGGTTPKDSSKTIEMLTNMLNSAQEREAKGQNQIAVLTDELQITKAKFKELESTLDLEREAREHAIELAVQNATKELSSKFRERYSLLKSKFEAKDREGKLEIQVADVDARLDMIGKLKKGELDIDGEENRLKDQQIDLELDLGIAAASDLSASDLATACIPDSLMDLDSPPKMLDSSRRID